MIFTLISKNRFLKKIKIRNFMQYLLIIVRYKRVVKQYKARFVAGVVSRGWQGEACSPEE